MIKNAIEQYYGFIRVQHPDYRFDPSLDNTIDFDSTIIEQIANVPNVKSITSRLETFALASSGNITKGVLVIGIDINREKAFSNPEQFLAHYIINKEAVNSVISKFNLSDEITDILKSNIGSAFVDSAKLVSIFDDLEISGEAINEILRLSKVEGQFLTPNDNGVVISSRLAHFLKAHIGDSLILLSQGYHGSSAAGLYPIRGIIRIPNPELDNQVVYMTLPQTQAFTSAFNKIAYYAINIENTSDEMLTKANNTISELLANSDLEVKTWKDLNKVLVQQIESDNQSGIIFLFLLYFVVFFGIFGTVIMMIHERIHEFAVLISVGMQRHKLFITVFVELVIMAIIGIALGYLVGLPIIHYYKIHPIRLTGELAKMMIDMGIEPLMPMAPFGPYITWQGITVLFMVILASIYPLRKITKLKEADSIKR
ncbi:MAG: ABC transporter permease [Bacteroidales bacterium]|nr:ABC transporter permease [Bacteroidales bacterium]